MYRIVGHILLVAAAFHVGSPVAAEFVRPNKPNDPLIYGVKNGIFVAIHPFGLDARKQGGPRGLIRVGYEEGGQYYLINYIAIEPLVGPNQGLSELEKDNDGLPGKRFWIGDSLKDAGIGQTGNIGGEIHKTAAGRVLSFVLHVAPFANGARPVIEVSLFEDAPDRIRFRTYSGPGGQVMRRCTLTATMGNQSRCRNLWLRSEPVFAPALYAGYSGVGFIEKQVFDLADLWKTNEGDVVAAISPDEFEPREVWPLSTGGWHHDGKWMAQFWLKPKGSYDKSLKCRVNGRRVYWASDKPIPGGIAYENFEFREDFHPGQELWFGFTAQSPANAFGFGYDASPAAVPRRVVPKGEMSAATKAERIARPLTNGDFTSGLDGWETEGGAGEFHMFHRGTEIALTTFGENKDADTGRLYQCFQVPADAIELKFSMHGGADPERTYVGLWHGDRLHRRMTAQNDNTPFRVAWDVVPLRNKIVTLEIVDKSVNAWGFVGVQDFVLVAER